MVQRRLEREREREIQNERDKALVINQWGPATATNKMAATSSLRSLRSSPDNIRSRCPDSRDPDCTGLWTVCRGASIRVGNNTGCWLMASVYGIRSGVLDKTTSQKESSFQCPYFQAQNKHYFGLMTRLMASVYGIRSGLLIKLI